MNPLKKVAAAAVLALALAACGPSVVSGVVTQKEHSPARAQYCGKGCFMMLPESWDLRVQGVTEEGDPATEWVSVSETEWDAYDVGDTYAEEDQ